MVLRIIATNIASPSSNTPPTPPSQDDVVLRGFLNLIKLAQRDYAVRLKIMDGHGPMVVRGGQESNHDVVAAPSETSPQPVDSDDSDDSNETPSVDESLIPPYVPVKDDENTADENQRCCICMDRKKQCAFLPCGHVDCCLGCVWKIYSENDKSLKCPTCRSEASRVVRLYL